MAEKKYTAIKAPGYSAAKTMNFVFDPENHVLVAGDAAHRELVRHHLGKKFDEETFSTWSRGWMEKRRTAVIPGIGDLTGKIVLKKIGVLCAALKEVGSENVPLKVWVDKEKAWRPVGKVHELAKRAVK